MKKLDKILENLSRAAGALTPPSAPSGPFIFDVVHCCVKDTNGRYVNCIDYTIGGSGRTREDAQRSCERLATPGLTTSLGDGRCANSTCKPRERPTSPTPTPCPPSSVSWAECLVGMENSACKTRLQNLVRAWQYNKCVAFNNACNGLPQDPPLGSPGPVMQAHQCKACQCGVWRQYTDKLKNITSAFCSGSKDCDTVNRELDEACRSLSDGLRSCLAQPGCKKELIPRSPGGPNCGMGEA